ncbi:MAG TPA: small ribosomal subunit biogenesis GTPase RsgA [Hyphomicrobiales bacterium]|nr:small ribosomal subunit biogenesis GTPase RsgA [Hyphomicrobiales bacterium]
MSRKQLSKQQLARIQHQQNAHARALEADADATGPTCTALVLSRFGKQLEVQVLDGDLAGQVLRCFQRSNLEALVSGDRVVLQPGEPTAVVVAALPRRSLLQRHGQSGERKVVAANIDTMVIVIAPQPPPHYNLIDRYLVAAETAGFRPLLLLNKSDLDRDADTTATLDALLELYASLGYATLRCSSKRGDGLAQLQELLSGTTTIFVGQSGVGKSALVNALLPGVNTLEGTLSEAEDKGRHTTTAARLFHLPGGGQLIDSPGIREFGLGHIDARQVLEGFVEFRPWLGTCRFRDCRHEGEIGCALQEALANGAIDPRRMQSFRLIRDSL